MRNDPGKIAITVSLLASIVMLAGKLTAYFLTRSTAIWSDAAESVVHGAATGLAAFSYAYAARPADADHPYGHGRIAYFSAGFEGALVFAASLAVIYSGITGFIHGPQLQHLNAGLAIAGLLALFNLVLGVTLVRIGRKHNKLILIANGKHVLSDMWTTVAAIAGLGLVTLTDATWLDPLAALIIGGIIMASGISLVRGSYAGLMDTVDPDVSQRLIEHLQMQVREGTIAGFHQLRHRRVNNEYWIDVHLLVPGEIPTVAAHDRVTALEESIGKLFPNDKVHITSHIEPAEHGTAHPDGHEGLSDPLSTPPEKQP